MRLTLPEPIGLEEDLAAGVDRLLPALAERLRAKGQGARRVRLRVERTDRAAQWVDSFFSDPNYEAESAQTLLRIRPELYYRDKQTPYAGTYTHELLRDGDSYKIKSKRVDLINCDAALNTIIIYI